MISEEIYSDEKTDLYKPGYIGGDLYKFHFSRPPRTFKYVGNELDKFPEYKYVSWKDHKQYLKEKIVFRKVASSPHIMVIDDGESV